MLCEQLLCLVRVGLVKLVAVFELACVREREQLVVGGFHGGILRTVHGGQKISGTVSSGIPRAPQTASVAATSGEMSTVACRRDHKYASPIDRNFAPRTAS